MSDIRFNQWLHQSGTGGVSQVASGAVGVGTTNPLADFYVRGDAQITGILTAGHIAMGSSITFGDNDRIYLGDGTDFQLYHASSDNNSYIVESGAGSLVVNASKFHVKNAANNEDVAVFNQSGNNELYFSNSKKFETTNTGAVVTGILTATGDFSIADKIIHTGDTNTAIRFPAADTITAETAGNERLRITSAGSMGLGTNNPNDTLHVYHATDNLVARFESGDTGGGITLKDNTHVTSLLTTNGAFEINVDQGGDISGETIAFKMSGSEKLRIASGGQVNIGGDYTQTTYPFSVLGSTGGNNNINIVQRLKYSGDSNQYNTGTVIAFTNTNTNANAYSYIGARIDSGSSGANANALVFATNATNTAPTEKLRIDSSGRVLIGSTNGATYSDSSMDDLIIGSTANGKNDGLTILSGTAQNGSIAFADSGGTSRGLVGYVHNGDYLRFNTAGSERLRITSDGKIAINTDIVSDFIDILCGQDRENIVVVRGADRTTEYAAIGVSGGNAIITGGGIGSTNAGLSFRTAASGTEAERLLIDSSGRVTIKNGGSDLASAFNSGANQFVITHNASCGLTIDSTSSTSSSIHFADGATGGESYRGIIEYQHSVDDMKFAVEATHIARLRKGSYSDVGGGMIIGNGSDVSGDAHSDSRTLILGATSHGETGMTFLNSSSGSGKLRFSDGTSPFNQGTIAYYHGTRTIGSIPTYPESFSISPAQRDNMLVLNGNEAMRVSNEDNTQKMVDGFWEKSLNTSYQTVFTIQSGSSGGSSHYGYFYEIIVYGADWGSHSANRVYFKGFVNGYSGYGGHTPIEHSGPYGSNSGGGGSYGSSECQIQVVFGSSQTSEIQMRLTTGSVTAQGYARIIGYVRNYSGFHIR